MNAENNSTENKATEQPAAVEITSAGVPSDHYLVTEYLRTMPRIFARGLLYLIVLLLFVVLAYSILGQVDVVIECPAVARVRNGPWTFERTETRMEIVIANKDIGFVEKNMDIRCKFHAYPFTDHGALHGKIDTVADSAVEDATGAFVFRAEGTLDTPYFVVKGKTCPIKPGMTATAELVTGRKSIFSVLIAGRK